MIQYSKSDQEKYHQKLQKNGQHGKSKQTNNSQKVKTT